MRARKVKDTKRKTLQPFIKQLVRGDSTIITDEWLAYNGLDKNFWHERINHSQGEYVRDGFIHTNGIESFWALLKRGIVGQYHKVSAKHLDKYIREFAFRHNNPDISLAFKLALEKAVNS